MNTAVIAVAYLEPEWAQTKECLDALDVPVFLVDRAGTGSLAEAYNRGFAEHGADFDYVWLVSNVTFNASVCTRLIHLMEGTGYAAIHPEFDSDHAFIRSGDGLMPAPFVEFTAPMVRSDVFRAFPLNEDMPYWGHDLDWGHRVRRFGHTVAIDHGCRVDHTYVRHLKPSAVTMTRRQLRRSTDEHTRAALEAAYGADWKGKLWYGASSWTATGS